MNTPGVEFKWYPEAVLKVIRNGLARGLTDAAMYGANAASEIMGRVHGGVPSKPGEPPNIQTANLDRSISWVPATADKLESQYGTNVPYGPMLEFGTSKMAARPWLLPSYKRALAEMLAIIKSEVNLAASPFGADPAQFMSGLQTTMKVPESIREGAD